MTDGGRPFGPAALIAISTCGGWWVYPWAMRLAQVHQLLRFHAVTPCRLCLKRSETADTITHPLIGRTN